jgi:hypothetical protein
VTNLIAWLLALPDTGMKFSPAAWERFKQRDGNDAEPLRFADAMLAGRISEQAIKMAALIALSDRRLVIEVDDLDIAYAIRLGTYRRAAPMVRNDGAVSGMHATGKAVMQLASAFRRHGFIARSHLPAYSRSSKALSTAERESVVKSLTADGVARLDPDLPGRLVSLICETA